MNFGQAISSGFRNYVTFGGRASRSEYWYWVLFVVICAIVTAILDHALFDESALSPLNTIFSLVTFLPGLAVGVRRLHDTNGTGWWLLISLTVIGIIVLIVWFCQRGTIGSNQYGPDPIAGA